MEKFKCIGPCHATKLLSKFGPSKQYKNGHLPICRECVAFRAKQGEGARKVRKKKMRAFKRISEDNRTFFKLGVLKGQEGINDVKKAIEVLEKANKILLEVIKDADQRDLETQFGG